MQRIITDDNKQAGAIVGVIIRGAAIHVVTNLYRARLPKKRNSDAFMTVGGLNVYIFHLLLSFARRLRNWMMRVLSTFSNTGALQ